MFRVLDTIRLRKPWLRDYPDLPQKEGLLAVLAADQVRWAFPEVARVPVSKPDGTSATFDLAEVKVNPHGVVALFFCDLDEAEIPVGSFVEPLE